MKNVFKILACFLFCSMSYAQDPLYGPKEPVLVGKTASLHLASVFRVGGSSFNFSHLTISNGRRSHGDSAVLIEFDSNDNVANLTPLTLYLSSMDQSKDATRNFYRSSVPVVLKTRTKYAVLWSSGSNVQNSVLSGEMMSKYNTGLRNLGTFSVTNNVWTPLQNNMTLRVYGSIVNPLD